VTSPHWPIPKPYQPSHPFWTPRVFSSSNPIWIDGDGDGKYTSPRGYAKRVVAEAGADAEKLVSKLGDYDLAVTIQVASLLRGGGKKMDSPEMTKALENAETWVKDGFDSYLQAIRPK
jgi:hypothetical protein